MNRISAAEKLDNIEDLRFKELEQIRKIIEPLNLEIKEIPADGSCLYSAICDQLKTIDGPSDHKNLVCISFNVVHLHIAPS